MNYLNIANWILDATMAGSILVIIIMLIKKALRKKLNVIVHYYIWILLIIKLIIPSGPESNISIYNIINPSYSSSFYENIYEKAPSDLINNDKQIHADKTTGNDLELSSIQQKNIIPTSSIPHNKINYKKIFFIFWFIGAALAFIHTVIGLVRIKKIILSSTKDNEKVSYILEEAKEIVNFKRKIKLGFTNQISSPSLFGILNPIIIIPNTIAEGLTEKELRYIIIHELCHVKRKDIIISWLRVIFRIIHWFNPIVILGLNTMEKDCEISCDNTALSFLDNSENKAYGSTIVNVLQLVNRPIGLPGSTSIIMKKNDLKRRIKMISSYGKISISSIITGIVIILIVAAVGLTDKIAKADVSNSAINNTSIEATQNINVMSSKSFSITLLDNMEEFDNNRPTSTYLNLSQYLVTSEDVESMANELRRLGAANIYVNGEQISEKSVINPYGQFVEINGYKYIAPFIIKAEWNENISVDSLIKNSSIINKLKARGIGVKIEDSIDPVKTEDLESDKPVEMYKTTVPKTVSETSNKIEADNKINLNNLNFTLPANWVKRGNESEIFFDDENKQTVGGISVVGYYGDYGASLPNHSKILSTEDIDNSLGKGKLFIIERSNPAASNNPKTWNEIHAIIPANNNMAYDIWVKIKKDTLINILKSFH